MGFTVNPLGSPGSTIDLGGTGLAFITTQSFTAASTVSVDGCFTSGYDNYRVVVSHTASGGGNLTLRMRLLGTDNSSAQYDWQGGSFQNTSATGYRGAADTSSRLGPLATVLQGTVIDFISPAIAVQTVCMSKGTNAIATTPETYDFIARCSVATAYDGFTLIPSAGTITGTLTVYGYRKA